MNDSGPSAEFVYGPLDPDHPAYSAHLGAIRSIERVVNERAPYQNAQVASAGIGHLLRLKPLVLTGAGISTDSGIPDYRGPQGSLKEHRPMTYQEFMHDGAARHRYWARSFVGWQHMGRAFPNDGHRVLAQWNDAGIISGIVTQNVDGLHQQAARDIHGTGELITLHGDMEHVECLDCGYIEDREHLDKRFHQANPDFLESIQLETEDINPDGDARLGQQWVDEFTMVGCLNCGSVRLKPTVVYFGEAVPVERKQRINELVEESGALLIVGSSVAVMSGYKMVLDTVNANKPVAIINAGPSRADEKASFRWRTTASEALIWLNRFLSNK